MNLLEMTRAIEQGEFDPVIDEGAVKFYCRPPEYGVVQSPERSAALLEEGKRNVLHGTQPAQSDRLGQGIPGVTGALKAGWTIPFPNQVFTHPTNDGQPIVESDYFDNVWDYRARTGIECSDVIAEVDTRWVLELPEGWSALYCAPLNHTTPEYTQIPGVIDADKVPVPIRVPIVIHEDEFTVEAGEAFIEVYPFNRNAIAEVDATMGTFDPGEEPSEKGLQGDQHD